MTGKLYELNSEDKQSIIEKIDEHLSAHDEIIFGYVHGSFIKRDAFRDIDVAVYMSKDQLEHDFLKYEFRIEKELSELCHSYPIDVRCLNYAPFSFRYEVIKNSVLVAVKDDNARVDFQVKTWEMYFDFVPFRRGWLRRVLGLETNDNVMIRLISSLISALADLRRLKKIAKSDFLSDQDKISSAKYNFIVAIEAAIDICNHIIAQNQLGVPESYSDTFRIMGKVGVFETDFIETLENMAKYRNRLVHLYWDVDDERVYQILQENIGDFDHFLEGIESAVHSSKISEISEF